MTSLIWIWIIFALIFLVLSILHFIRSRKKIAPFQVTRRGSGGQVNVLGLDIDKPLNDFAGDFNKYLDGYNKSTSLQNIIAGIGYLAAAAIAFISMLFELNSKI